MNVRQKTLGLALAVIAMGAAPAAASAAAGPVASYGFEEPSGSTAQDISGHGNTGTITNATRTSAGKFGAALSFNGTNASVRVPDSASLDLSAGMTLEAWVNPTATSNYRTVVLKERPGDLSYALYANAGKANGQVTNTSSTGYGIAEGGATLATGTWTHLAATYDGTTVRVYVNGTLAASTTKAGTIFTSGGDLRIGGNAIWGEWFSGLIDEVRVYDRALSATEIGTDMTTAIGGSATPPPGADTVGSWTAPEDWPLVAVHASMLSNGKVAMWDAFGAALGSEHIWDPVTDSFASTPSGINLFCAGHVLLPDGRLFVAGGHELAYVGLRNTTLLDPLTGTWQAGPMMARGRWYPTTTTLPDGRVLIVSGDAITTGGPFTPFYTPSDTIPEIYDPAANTIKSIPSAGRKMPLYPFMFTTPDGRVVDAGPDKTTRILDVQTGTWSTLASQSPIDGHSAVMYRPGKILKSGTWTDPDFSGVAVGNGAAVLDMDQTVPAWRSVSPMKRKRTFHTLTVLPDGDVLAMGGQNQSGGNSVTSSAVLDPEIWHPATDTWTSMAPSQVPRGYHNTSLLLPDGRIMLAGSGRLEF